MRSVHRNTKRIIQHRVYRYSYRFDTFLIVSLITFNIENIIDNTLY